MANEAVKLYDESSGHGGVIQDYTVGNLDAIEKGALLSLQDGRIASGTVAIGVPLAGIAAREKVSGDGRTQLAVYKKGYFDMIASGVITFGSPVKAAGHSNYVIVAATGSGGSSGSQILGYAEDTSAADETICIRVNL